MFCEFCEFVKNVHTSDNMLGSIQVQQFDFMSTTGFFFFSVYWCI